MKIIKSKRQYLDKAQLCSIHKLIKTHNYSQKFIRIMINNRSKQIVDFKNQNNSLNIRPPVNQS